MMGKPSCRWDITSSLEALLYDASDMTIAEEYGKNIAQPVGVERTGRGRDIIQITLGIRLLRVAFRQER